MKIYLIGGGTASGKTTLANKLMDIWLFKGYKTESISVDMFYKTTSPDTNIATYNFDTPDALDIDMFFEKLFSIYFHNKTYLPVYNFETFTLTEDEQYIHDPDILIVEGILLFELLYNFTDYISSKVLSKFKLSISKANELIQTILEDSITVFISTSEELEEDNKIRLHRKIERDIIERNRSSLDTIQMWNNNSFPAHFKYVQKYEDKAEASFINIDDPYHVKKQISILVDMIELSEI